MTPEEELSKGQVSFQTEGRLLQELGERLVASPEVALVELVKNSYDADASICEVIAEDNGKRLRIRDDGSGMSLDVFKSRWMRVATSSKQKERASATYGRRVTGQKGIGRFAVRFLGAGLDLDTVSVDQQRGHKTRLIANFRWNKIDRQADLSSAIVPYTLYRADPDVPTGTELSIRSLRVDPDFVASSTFRTEVLRIVSPISGLDRGPFERSDSQHQADPGFRVSLPGDAANEQLPLDLAAQVLANAWAQLTIKLVRNDLRFRIRFSDDEEVRRLRLTFPSRISAGCFADIRYFPRRSGIFRAKGIDGKVAWKWVRDNHGVGVVDHGFRVKPYGFPDDDWLRLDIDAAHNERNWRSAIAKEHFSILPTIRADPALNPALNLPSSFQLVGAAFVESRPASLSTAETDLTPSMDREGFLENAAFRDLKDIIRAGIEFLANEDKKRLAQEKEDRARAAAKKLRRDLRAAVTSIEQSPTLSRGDKTRLVTEYAGLAEKLESVEDYSKEAQLKFSLMSSIGVVAGFMTHEAGQMLEAVRDVADIVHRLAKREPPLRELASRIDKSFEAISAQIDYTRSFIDAASSPRLTVFRAAPQVKRIIAKFGTFAKDREIRVTNEVSDDIETPPLPVSMYSGILLNLYTNALKAIIARKRESGPKRVVFRAWNEPQWHIVEVLDTGIGIPAELQARVWDPLFTTTSRLDSPLGTGMGLGLSLVKQLVAEVGGKISIVDPPPEFSTCFKVQFKRGARA